MGTLSNAQKSALAALLVVMLTALVDLRLAWIPLVLYGGACLAGSFLHRFSFYLPIVSRGTSGRHAVALTFDDGPDPGTTGSLLQLLDDHDVKATFFVTGRRAEAYPELIQDIIGRGHTVGNHSYSHSVRVAFKGAPRVYGEIIATQEILGRLGVTPLVYRPPVGITYPALAGVLRRLDLTAVTFSCSAGDRGNRTVTTIARRILRKAGPDDILMLHDLLPARREQRELWLGQVTAVLEGLKAKGLEVLPLARIIGRPVDHR